MTARSRNIRGNAKARRKRRLALFEAYQVGGVLLCQRPGCEVPLLLDGPDRFEVDRITAGMHGGRYVKGNCRPLCPPCNRELGNATRDGMQL